MVKASKFLLLQISKPSALSRQLQEGGQRRGCPRLASLFLSQWSPDLSGKMKAMIEFKSRLNNALKLPVQ